MTDDRRGEPSSAVGAVEDVRRHRAWTRRAARPIWYGPVARVQDWWNGWRDGRRGIPWFDPGKEGPSPPQGADAEPAASDMVGADGHQPCPHTRPPYVRYLESQATDSARVEWVRAESRVVNVRARVDELCAGVKTLLENVSECERHLKAMPEAPDEDFLATRRIGEERHGRPASLSRARRRNEHVRMRARAEQALGQATDLYRARSEVVARLNAVIAAEERVRDARMLRVRVHMERRAASYWRHLVRHHRHGPRLSACLDTAGHELPAWAGNTDRNAESRSPQGRASDPDGIFDSDIAEQGGQP